MIKIKELSPAEFDAFAKKHVLLNFLQSSYLGERRRESNWEPYYLGFYRDTSLHGAMLVQLYRTNLGLKLAESQHGPYWDFSVAADVRDATKALRTWLRKKFCMNITMNPNVCLRVHIPGKGSDLAESQDQKIGQDCQKHLQEAGWAKLDKVDDDPMKMSWYFVKDFSAFQEKQEIFQSFNQAKKGILKIAAKMPIYVRSLTKSELPEFKAMMDMTSERRDFAGRTLSYFESMLEQLPPETLFYWIATLDVKAYREQLAADSERLAGEIEKQKARGDQAKAQKKLVDLGEQMEAVRKKQASLSEIKVDKLNLNCGLFIALGNEMVHLYGGGDETYMHFQGATVLQWHAMQHCFEMGLRRYNMYGTMGNFCGHPEMEGVFQFKNGFDGFIEEQVGYFRLSVLPWMERLYMRLHKLRG